MVFLQNNFMPPSTKQTKQGACLPIFKLWDLEQNVYWVPQDPELMCMLIKKRTLVGSPIVPMKNIISNWGHFYCDSDSCPQTSSQLLSSSPVTKFNFLLVNIGLKLSNCLETATGFFWVIKSLSNKYYLILTNTIMLILNMKYSITYSWITIHQTHCCQQRANTLKRQSIWQLNNEQVIGFHC